MRKLCDSREETALKIDRISGITTAARTPEIRHQAVSVRQLDYLSTVTGCLVRNRPSQYFYPHARSR